MKTWTDVIADTEAVRRYVIEQERREREWRRHEEFVYVPIPVPTKKEKEGYTF